MHMEMFGSRWDFNAHSTCCEEDRAILLRVPRPALGDLLAWLKVPA